jgi:hypothetical protein
VGKLINFDEKRPKNEKNRDFQGKKLTKLSKNSLKSDLEYEFVYF